jgi:nitroimidazol reductase NimA-like FMN-containing flavoprotein (pyridoxamine 5'-phosphate oxidase superfamily)
MTDADVTPGNAARVATLSRPRCIELLKQERWGRVAFQDWDGPQLLPVSYVYWTGNVVFRTSDHGILAGLRRRSNAAFEIDGIDAAAGTAWSVLVRGSSQEMTNTYELGQVWTNPELVPLAAGHRPLVIAIEPRTITGRELTF